MSAIKLKSAYLGNLFKLGDESNYSAERQETLTAKRLAAKAELTHSLREVNYKHSPLADLDQRVLQVLANNLTGTTFNTFRVTTGRSGMFVNNRYIDCVALNGEFDVAVVDGRTSKGQRVIYACLRELQDPRPTKYDHVIWPKEDVRAFTSCAIIFDRSLNRVTTSRAGGEAIVHFSGQYPDADIIRDQFLRENIKQEISSVQFDAPEFG